MVRQGTRLRTLPSPSFSQVEEAQKAAVQKAQQEAARCRFCGGSWEKIMEKMGKTWENHGGNMGKSSNKWSFSWENLLGMEVSSWKNHQINGAL